MSAFKYPPSHRTFGLELEFFLMDHEGNIVNKADSVIENLKKDLTHTDLKKECGRNMIEIATFPHLSSRHVFSNFFNDFENLIYNIDKQDLCLFYYGTYPGENMGKIRDEKRYKAKEKILGKDNFLNAAKCIGFHYHYSLPRNSFNHNIKFFYPDIKKKYQQKVLNVYNLFIALDPAITTLMQSSPYFQGEYLGKDSRMIAYRGDSIFDNKTSLYERRPEFGNINKYSPNFTELIKTHRHRFDKWNSLLKRHGFSFSSFQDQASILDSSWKPVKISAHGTIESRGSDMNSPSMIVSLSAVLKTITRYINKNKIDILPSEIGNDNPFKLEDNTLYVPEFKYLKENLQKKSALYGIKDNEVFNYCNSLIKLVKKIIPENKKIILNKFSEILEEKETTSDRIIDFVKKKQGEDFYIQEETAKNVAIDSARRLFKDILITKKMYEKLNF
jgi:hypothetical protein